MKSINEIDKARKTLKLGEKATIPEIKESFRKLSLKYHPDKCKDKDKKKYEEKFKEINEANQILIAYCLNYKFPFTEERSSEEKEMEEHMERFYDGWWGNINSE